MWITQFILDIMFGMKRIIVSTLLVLLMDCEVSLKWQAQGWIFTWSYRTLALHLFHDSSSDGDIWLHWIWQHTQMSPWGTIPTGLFAVPKERRNLNGGPFDCHAEISSALKTENPLFTQGKFLSWWYKLYASPDHITLSRRMESFWLYLQLF